MLEACLSLCAGSVFLSVAFTPHLVLYPFSTNHFDQHPLLSSACRIAHERPDCDVGCITTRPSLPLLPPRVPSQTPIPASLTVAPPPTTPRLDSALTSSVRVFMACLRAPPRGTRPGAQANVGGRRLVPWCMAGARLSSVVASLSDDLVRCVDFPLRSLPPWDLDPHGSHRRGRSSRHLRGLVHDTIIKVTLCEQGTAER